MTSRAPQRAQRPAEPINNGLRARVAQPSSASGAPAERKQPRCILQQAAPEPHRLSHIIGGMLLYLPTTSATGPSPDDAGAIIDQHGRPLCLWTTLAAARRAGDGPILVVDTDRLHEAPAPDARGHRWVPHVPAEACCNLSPYYPPRLVTAAGGYVVRAGDDGPEVLLIFRNGVWDLPKGKRDRGEAIKTCALREVREEVGADDLHLDVGLGTTQHTYVRTERFCIKTTHWFLMHTTDTAFTPQADEGIDAVRWTPWTQAQAEIGYASLRDHMDTVADTVRQRLG